MKNVIIISVFFMFILSCIKKDECLVEQMIPYHFESDFGCDNTMRSLKIDLTNNCALIRTIEDYNNKVSGACHPEINFSWFDLIIGRQSSDYLIDTILYDLKWSCPDNEYILTVDMVKSATVLQDTVVFHAIIPKIADWEGLKININVTK